MDSAVTQIKKYWPALLPVLAIFGILDSTYLTWIHYSNVLPPCVGGIFTDCGKVLNSSYSVVFGIPLALIGIIQYTLEFIFLSGAFLTKKRAYQAIGIFLTIIGFFASAYFVFLQLFIIQALCQYCMASALISFSLAIGAVTAYPRGRTFLIAVLTQWGYRWIGKPILFRIDPEKVHILFTNAGRVMGDVPPLRSAMAFAFDTEDPRLTQTLAGITFRNPIGIAAGFDYEANLTQILAPMGFGFQSVGTITNNPYEGNPRPMLGRLPLSKSLMVNKGFKNLGAEETVKKLEHLRFPIPVGISIGRTNTKNLLTQKDSVKDIICAFETFEFSKVQHAYYELNISCPNLYGTISFYPPKNLEALLKAVDSLHLTRPLFVKMPISEPNKSQTAMLEVIAKHSSKGVIYGNLQKNRSHPSLVQTEVAKFPVGNFSGKPTYERSNELISLCYKHYKDRFVIIGCGGVFSPEDAYEKIRRGASLVQLITGMIYQGPQLISRINNDLAERMNRQGLAHVTDLVGSEAD